MLKKISELGAIDCDMHPSIPHIDALLPHLSEHWRSSIEDRGIESFDSIAYPPNSPLTSRPEWREEAGRVPSRFETFQAGLLSNYNVRYAIGNCLYGVHMAFSEDLAAGLARAVNDWVVKNWLDADPRMRASIVIPIQNVEYAVDEIERRASDRRFVQVLLPAMAEAPLGRRSFWPIYAAAAKHDLTIGIHAGSMYRFPVTPVGWPSYYAEDYASQAQAFQGQVASLICEGVFAKYPDLRVVLLESGVTWLTPFLWRLTKFWRALRSEVPWVDRPPLEIAKHNIRLTTQPFDAPDDADHVARIIDRMQSDAMLLFASDYPHWQFEDDNILPAGLSDDLIRKIAVENPLAAYPRLREENHVAGA